MDILYRDRDIIVCIKPAGVLSTDVPGGLPDLIRQALGDPHANVRTVHRLDRVVSGLMVLATRAKAASALSRQIREGSFQKSYCAVVHGRPEPEVGTFCDLLIRDKMERKTYLAAEPSKETQEAVLHYRVEASSESFSKVSIRLVTGRTHQIRAQFSGHGYPLVGDRKYGIPDHAPQIALWSASLQFFHPYSGEPMEFTAQPPTVSPWDLF